MKSSRLLSRWKASPRCIGCMRCMCFFVSSYPFLRAFHAVGVWKVQWPNFFDQKHHNFFVGSFCLLVFLVVPKLDFPEFSQWTNYSPCNKPKECPNRDDMIDFFRKGDGRQLTHLRYEIVWHSFQVQMHQHKKKKKQVVSSNLQHFSTWFIHRLAFFQKIDNFQQDHPMWTTNGEWKDLNSSIFGLPCLISLVSLGEFKGAHPPHPPKKRLEGLRGFLRDNDELQNP